MLVVTWWQVPARACVGASVTVAARLGERECDRVDRCPMWRTQSVRSDLSEAGRVARAGAQPLGSVLRGVCGASGGESDEERVWSVGRCVLVRGRAARGGCCAGVRGRAPQG